MGVVDSLSDWLWSSVMVDLGKVELLDEEEMKRGARLVSFPMGYLLFFLYAQGFKVRWGRNEKNRGGSTGVAWIF